MNRKWLMVLGIVFVLLVFGGCGTPTPIIFNENLSEAESAHLYFDYGLEVKEYNGIPVEHSKFMSSTNSKWRYVYLPPGEMEFMADVNRRGGYNTFYTASDVYFRYKFEAGKTYSLFFTAYGGPDEKQWGVRIYESPKVGYANKEDFIAFVPFYQYKN